MSHIKYKRSQMGMLGGVFLLMAVTIYMALAGPYALFNLKQSETSELRTVIVIARHGDEWPSSEAYFLGEMQGPTTASSPSSGRADGGEPGQLTGVGKERMYLLGKFLRLRYYDRLLAGDPRRLHMRSADSDKCLESAQLLAAGLNPPQARWVWSLGGADEALASRWQPAAVHTTDERYDDLLASKSRCLLDFEGATWSEPKRARAQAWKNSSAYMQLLNEFRHDLQMLRQHTGLEFEDDLEILVNIEEHLRARAALGDTPRWYTSTLAQRLTHIADVTAGCKFGQHDTQRLYSGRLLDVIARNIFAQLHGPSVPLSVALTDEEDQLDALLVAHQVQNNEFGQKLFGPAKQLQQPIGRPPTPPREQDTCCSGKAISVYMTDGQHMTALLNALKVYTALPHYGSLLIIELHHDPVNKVHFLRLFTVNALSHNTFPEPVRVNPIACPIDSAECSPEQFEQNIRHLSVDKRTWWQALCKNLDDAPAVQPELQPSSSSAPAASTITTPQPASASSNQEQQQQPNGESGSTVSTTETSQTMPSTDYDKLDQSLIVGPTDVRPAPEAQPSASTPSTTTAQSSSSSEIPRTTTPTSTIVELTTQNSSQSDETIITDDQGTIRVVGEQDAKIPTETGKTEVEQSNNQLEQDPHKYRSRYLDTDID